MVVDKRKPTKLSRENIPASLGLLNEVPAFQIQSKLHETLDRDYIEKVKKRLLEHHPKMTEDEFEWCFFELKRYFLLNSIMKQVPMFSEEVDEVWHELILFTQPYHNFTSKFYGGMLHHMPNLKGEGDPNQRALFDWVYSQLFQITEYSWKTWGDFFRHPLNSDLLRDFKNENMDYLKKTYFKTTEDNLELVEFLIHRLKNQLKESEEIYKKNKKGEFLRVNTFGNLSALSTVLIFYSYFYYDEYWEMAKLYTFANVANHTSGCSAAAFCGTGSNDDSGDSGGGSSCSSCSGCGGSS
ncbi:hypothetical protein [Bacillus sp. Marseille-P3661]|uniref:hypothetical protein n=1 Tax=Bacillus sp. Marseille-P3661 TaxID=1936234 RepID=UPI0011594564|nr:hypothetical protein [Bacillus sp. Marseille-P3661]